MDFPNNIGNENCKYNERFDQDVAIDGRNFIGKCSTVILADFCRKVQHAVLDVSYKHIYDTMQF